MAAAVTVVVMVMMVIAVVLVMVLPGMLLFCRRSLRLPTPGRRRSLSSVVRKQQNFAGQKEASESFEGGWRTARKEPENLRIRSRPLESSGSEN